jgi:hypothetical protein
LRAAVCARSSNSACCRWRAVSTRPLSRSDYTRSAPTPRSLFDCLVDFNALAPLDSRLSGSQRNDRVAHAHPGLPVCYMLDS